VTVPDVLPTAAELRQSLLDVLEHEDDQCLWEVVWTLRLPMHLLPTSFALPAKWCSA
jgi:hypothetical protein